VKEPTFRPEFMGEVLETLEKLVFKLFFAILTLVWSRDSSELTAFGRVINWFNAGVLPRESVLGSEHFGVPCF